MTSMRAGASMALNAAPGMAFDRFILLRRGRAGRRRRGRAVRWRGRGPAGFHRPVAAVDLPDDPLGDTLHASVEITADTRSLTITSWATFRDDGGIALSNLGVVGSQLAHFARTDDGVVAEELKAYRPDLIVLAFGTNEGFALHFDPVAFEAVLRSQITRLRLLSGDVPILLLGAPDLAQPPACIARQRTRSSGGV